MSSLDRYLRPAPLAVTRRLPVRGAIAALALAAGGLLPATAGAQEQLAPPPGQTVPGVTPIVSHYAGVTVWSSATTNTIQDRYENLREHTTYELTAHRNGQQGILPVPARDTPFDVELGPDEDGDVVAVYSRCDDDGEPADYAVPIFSLPYPAWTSGFGCDLYRYDFATGQESLIEGASTGEASEMLPSVWGDQIAFARVYERRVGKRAVYPYLYVRPLDGGRSQRQPGGSRGTTGLPGPTRLDLYGRRLSFVWNYATEGEDDRGRSELRLDTVGGDHEVLDSARFNPRGGDSYATYLSPSASGGRIFSAFQRIQRTITDTGVTDRSLESRLLRYRISTGERSIATPGRLTPLIWSVATDGNTTIVGRGDTYYNAAGSILRFTDVDYR